MSGTFNKRGRCGLNAPGLKTNDVAVTDVQRAERATNTEEKEIIPYL